LPPAAELPPAAVPSESLPPHEKKKKKKKKHHHEVDNLLPPGADPNADLGLPPAADLGLPPAADAGLPPSTETHHHRTAADALLPPGAIDEPTLAPGREQALPEPEKQLAPGEFAPPPGELPGEGLVTLPTADGHYRTVRDAGKVIGHGEEELELRRLTPEEKARRRTFRNIIMVLFCLALLGFVSWLMTR
jgi:hypothetical protein